MIPSFAHPWALPLLVLLPPCAWWLSRRPRAAWLFSDMRLLPDVSARPRRVARWSAALRCAGLAAIILALAGPRWPDLGSRVPTEGISIAVVLDISSSMSEADFRWDGSDITRLEAAKRVLQLLVAGGTTAAGELAGRPDDLLALVTFATRPDTACPLTLDQHAWLQILDAQQPRTAAGEATTNPGDALAWALVALQNAPTRRKAIVFLTDGESNVPEGLRPRQAAQLAGNLRIPIYAIDVSPDVSPSATTGDLAKARAALESVAELTHGRYFRARDEAALAEAGSAIDRLERDVTTGLEYRRYYEGYLPLALVGLGCWVLLMIFEATRWRQAP